MYDAPPRQVREAHSHPDAMRDRYRRRPILYSLIALAVLTAGGASAGYATLVGSRVSATAVAAEIAPILAADSLAPALHPGVHEVYAARQGQPGWFAAAARDAALAVLASAADDALPYAADLDDLRARADTSALAPSLGALDVALTNALLRHGDALSTPRADAAALYGHNWEPVPPAPTDGAPALADALGQPDPSASVAAWAESQRPQHPGYRRLRAALARENALADGALHLDRDLAPGDSGAAVIALRARLAVEGADAESDAPTGYDDALTEAVRTVQRDRGLDPTGRLDGPTRAALNKRHTELIPLLAINLEKWRWLPRDLGDLHVWVNVPRFELAVRERGDDPERWEEAIRFRSVVGARDWQTPAFTDTLQTIVFNPTWTVPASIQRESYGHVRGRVVRPPGPGNAMGRVKFLFPNKHAVYVHDTPTKWAFNVDDRARSHGCIRAGDPEGLARTLLTRTNAWEAEQVADIFRGSWRRTQHVQVEATVPVHLVYFTAEVDPDGRLRVYDDVYGRDGRLADALGLERPDPRGAVLATLIADTIGGEDAAQEDETTEEDAESEPTEAETTEANPADAAEAEESRPTTASRAEEASAPVEPSADEALEKAPTDTSVAAPTPPGPAPDSAQGTPDGPPAALSDSADTPASAVLSWSGRR